MKLYNGDCIEVCKENIDNSSIDCIITDPPYEIGFMSADWDASGIAENPKTWAEFLRVLKPGGYCLAFGGSRTFHRIAVAMEKAGFEIRDTIMWIYSSGMPKGQDVGLAIDKMRGIDNRTGTVRTDGKATNSGTGIYQANVEGENSMKREFEERKAKNRWAGWKSTLKPAFEPVIVARKPLRGGLANNVTMYGVGALNIDDCRIPHNEPEKLTNRKARTEDQVFSSKTSGFKSENLRRASAAPEGRFPSNVIFEEDEDIFAGLPEGVSRFFYCPKASRKDRDEGLTVRNTHTTVKPVALMQYLVRLVAPENAKILDPFMGSGSTGKAVAYENKEREMNYEFIGIEKEPEYYRIAEKRIAAAEASK